MKTKQCRKRYVRKNRITCKQYAGSAQNTSIMFKKNIDKLRCSKKKIDNEYWNFLSKHDVPKAEHIKKCTVIYKNGDIYEGLFDDLKFEKYKYGKMDYKIEDTYIGEWKNDKIYDTYIGEWENDKKNREGSMMYHTGHTYNGIWENDKKHGKGIMVYPNDSEFIKYEGKWENDKKHGEGIMDYKNGYTYNGYWKDDKKHGKGIMDYNNGNRKIGYWVNDSMFSVSRKSTITTKI